jgi:hypothetical protein
MGKLVIAAYRPKPGKESELHELVSTHVPILKDQGLVTAREPITMKAADGTYVEVFEWMSADAINAAHTNEVVLEMWAKFSEVCDYVPISETEEASRLFSEYEPIDFEAIDIGAN